MVTTNYREFNFIAENENQSKDPEYGGKPTNTYEGYNKKIFILDNSVNNTHGGISFINNHMDVNARSVSTNIDNDFTIENANVNFYPRVQSSASGVLGATAQGQTGNNFALFNGSSILSGADIKHADIYLTHTLFQKTNNDNDNIVTKKDDSNILLDENTIETDGKANKMIENNVYTFIDEDANINVAAGTKCVIGPNIYVGQRTKIGPDNKLSNIYIGPDCELNTQWDYSPENPSDLNKMKLSQFFQGPFKLVHVSIDDVTYNKASIVMREIEDSSKPELVNKINNLLGLNETQSTQFRNRNAQNKNIWIGQNIKISETNCFNKISPKSGINASEIENLIVLNKSKDTSQFEIKDTDYQFFHNCIIELDYYKSLFNKYSSEWKNTVTNFLQQEYKKKIIFVFVDTKKFINLNLKENIFYTSGETSTSSRSRSSRGVSSSNGTTKSKKKTVSGRNSGNNLGKLSPQLEALLATAAKDARKNIPYSKFGVDTGRLVSKSTSSRSSRDSTAGMGAVETGEIADEITAMTSDILNLIKDLKGVEGRLQGGGGGSTFISKIQLVDDSLNQLKFLESKIQETSVGKDKDKNRIGLFNFITKESKKELKDKQLLKGTEKLYRELENDKKDLEPYYSSNFVLQDKDFDKLVAVAQKTNAEFVSDATYLKIKTKLINSDTDKAKDFIDRLRTLHDTSTGNESKLKNNICKFLVQVLADARTSNKSLANHIAKLMNTGGPLAHCPDTIKVTKEAEAKAAKGKKAKEAEAAKKKKKTDGSGGSGGSDGSGGSGDKKKKGKKKKK
jgi:hypothetical protein